MSYYNVVPIKCSICNIENYPNRPTCTPTPSQIERASGPLQLSGINQHGKYIFKRLKYDTSQEVYFKRVRNRRNQEQRRVIPTISYTHEEKHFEEAERTHINILSNTSDTVHPNTYQQFIYYQGKRKHCFL